jgi:succinate dehydrogenase / fumarate reductase flavoprotein subunit
MLTIAECIVRAAIERRESRGAHWRLDYLDKDPALGRVNFVAFSDDGALRLKQRQVPQMPPELAKLFDGEAPVARPPLAPPEAKRVPA